ncbi:MAG TPA: hypothetical protein VGA78_08230 [Gemmatimonadales bacterium]
MNSSAADGLPGISTDGLALYFSSRCEGGSGGMGLWVARRNTRNESFSRAETLGFGVNSASDDWGPGISSDGLQLYVMSNRPGGHGREDLWVTTRASTSATFGSPRNLGPLVNSATLDGRPNLSADGTTLFFMSDRPGGSGQIDLWQASTRAHRRR